LTRKGRWIALVVIASFAIVYPRAPVRPFTVSSSTGHAGVNTASAYYFAEGTCRPNFDAYICVLNPGGSAVEATITYMTGNGTTTPQNVVVPAHSRATVHPVDVLGVGDDAAHDFSAKVECAAGQRIIAERPMYFNYKGEWTGGHNVMGATAPVPTFYFAEGTCRPGFDPYLCIQNPGSSDAQVKITYMKGDGTNAVSTIDVAASSRSTVSPRAALGTGNDEAHDFSVQVECTNSQGVIAERPMYFNYKGEWTGGHNVLGAPAPSTDFYFAEGTCRPDFDTFFSLLNPGSANAEVTLTYMKSDGATMSQNATVPPASRRTVHPADVLGVGDDAAHDFSTRLSCTNGQKIIAERPMYFNYNGAWSGGHDVVGAEDTRALTDVRFFAYQLQNQEQPASMKRLVDSHYDLLVIDQTRSVKGQEAYDSRRDVMRLKASSGSTGHGKVVICYLDVGEAESYRWYWNSDWRVGNPSWIVAPDPGGWDGNFPVAYWTPEWKSIMSTAIDRIIDDGYDGVYLDWLEAYAFEPVAAAARAQDLNARKELIDFVRGLEEHARQRDPGFIFVAQNAAELGAYPDWLKLFDGIGQESIWYDGAGDPDAGGTPGDVPVDAGLTRDYLQDLSAWRANGKVVLDIEYARKPANVSRAYALGASRRFKTYVTLVPLDSLSATPPPGY
jgi:cysteinyl-tRNA synthetase